MDQKFYLQPFAFAGDVTAIPDAVQPSGAVSFNQGFGFDYQRELGVDPDAKAVPRQESNYLYKTITENLGAWQRYGTPEWITAADNGGVAFPYARGVVVRYRALPSDPFQLLISRIDNNTTTPAAGTDWAPFTFEIATNAQALAGADNTTIMSPLRVAEAVAALAPSIPDASETVKGKIELATQAEVNTGTDAVRAVTPATLQAKLTAALPDASTTVKGIVELATTAETSTGTDAVRAVTPAGIKPTLDLKAPLLSPAFTGTPTAPTAAAGTNTTQLATTAYVFAGLALKANLASPAFTGTPTAPTAVAGTNTTQLATTAFVRANDDPAKANLAGATFTGAVSVSTGGFTASGGITSVTNWFKGSATIVNLCTDGPGTVYLRPNGQASTSGQMTVSSTGAVAINGTCTATGGFGPPSSKYLKDLSNDPVGYGLDTISRIQTARGKYKSEYNNDGRERLFFIAEQIRDVIPEMELKDAVEFEGKKLPGLDITQLLPVLVEALKEAHDEIVSLRKRVAVLEG